MQLVGAEQLFRLVAPCQTPCGTHSEVVEKVEYYVIKKGDTLSALAKKYYGKASEYPRIFEANREVIKDPDLIFAGQKIRVLLSRD